jgi:DNA-binding winged helix-turn-helix (wHTH) protein
MGNSIPTPVARFEDFEVHLETGEVWKAGRPLKVQDQPFKVLAALLGRPGQIVTREELRQLIWPDKNFGDFDHAINLALAKLRATLGDSADVPHLIETLPRRGYRFIAPLKEQSDPPPARIIAPPQEQTVPSPVKAHPAMAAGKKLWLIVGALALIGVAGAVTEVPDTSGAVNCRRDCALSLYARPAGHACHFPRRQPGCFCLFERTAPRDLYRPDRRRKAIATHRG